MNDDTVDPKFIALIEQAMIAEDAAALDGTLKPLDINITVEVTALDTVEQTSLHAEYVERLNKIRVKLHELTGWFPQPVAQLRKLYAGVDGSLVVAFALSHITLRIDIRFDLSVVVSYSYDQITYGWTNDLDTERISNSQSFTAPEPKQAIIDLLKIPVTKLLAAHIASKISDTLPARQPVFENVYGCELITDKYDTSLDLDMKRVRRYFQKRKAQARARTGRRR